MHNFTHTIADIRQTRWRGLSSGFFILILKICEIRVAQKWFFRDPDSPANHTFPAVNRLIKQIKPDVLVKGGDYQIHEVVGRDIVENSGGKVILIPLVSGRSSSNIIEKIQNENKTEN